MAHLWILRLFSVFMKLPCVIVFGIFLVGCASSQPKTSLSAEQATRLAIQADNTKAEGCFNASHFTMVGQPD